MTALEIAVQDVRGLRVAFEAGADRVELCQALQLGGLTPSRATIEAAMSASRGRRVHVLVRPHPGGFVLDEDAIDILCADARGAIAAGADAVVAGALTVEGRIDARATERLLEATDGALVAHRAVDAAVDPIEAVETLAMLGVRAVLTSGGATRARDALEVLREMRSRAPQIALVVGGGVRADDVSEFVELGAEAVHLSARRTVDGPAAGPGGGSCQVDMTDPELVRDAARALQGAMRG